MDSENLRRHSSFYTLGVVMSPAFHYIADRHPLRGTESLSGMWGVEEDRGKGGGKAKQGGLKRKGKEPAVPLSSTCY